MFRCGVLTRCTHLRSRLSSSSSRNSPQAGSTVVSQCCRPSALHCRRGTRSIAQHQEWCFSSFCQQRQSAPASRSAAASSVRQGRWLSTSRIRPQNAVDAATAGRASGQTDIGSGSHSGGGGTAETQHTPVLLDEILSFFEGRQLRTFVDGTLGAAGHSCAIAAAHPELWTLVGIDQDASALDIARPRLAAAAGGRPLVARLHHGNFRDMQAALQFELGSSGGVAHGILLDLGVSSMQIDQAERGFSFLRDGPLDMRMCGGSSGSFSAEALVNTADEAELGRILRDLGEERAWRSIAARIVRRRDEKPIRTTQQLVAAIGGGRGSGRSGRRGIHPATRTFQALRIAVNDELAALAAALPAAIDCLAPGGRLAVISFHSLEDRIVKHAFLTAAGRAPEEHPDLRLDWDPRATLRPPALVSLITRRPVTAGEQEQRDNPRSRSAKLRVLERLSAADE